MRVAFTTKEESNREREQAFLALTGEERMAEFFALSRRIMREWSSSYERDYGDNFALRPEDRKPKSSK